MFLIALFRWKKRGFFGCVALTIVGITANVLNIDFRTVPFLRIMLMLFVDLLPVGILYAVLQLGRKRSGWSQLQGSTVTLSVITAAVLLIPPAVLYIPSAVTYCETKLMAFGQKENSLLIGKWRLSDENARNSEFTCTFFKNHTWEEECSAILKEVMLKKTLIWASGSWRIERDTLIKTYETTKAAEGLEGSLPSGKHVHKIIRVDDSVLVLENSSGIQSVYTRVNN